VSEPEAPQTIEVRFEKTTGNRWRVGWWLASVGAGLMAVGIAGAFVGPLTASRNGPEGVIYFAIGVTAATIGVVVFLIGRNLMLRRIVSYLIDDDDSNDTPRYSTTEDT
jgi:hypothetical protein